MVEKNIPSNDKSERDDESGNHECDPNETTFHQRNLYLASIPLLASFALLNYFSHVLFLLFRFLWEHIIKLRRLVRPFHLTSNRSKISIENPTTDVLIEMPKAVSAENQLLKQKLHHRKAFECISQALKIDEENEGKIQLTIKHSNVVQVGFCKSV